jgi:hypothetical protein
MGLVVEHLLAEVDRLEKMGLMVEHLLAEMN